MRDFTPNISLLDQIEKLSLGLAEIAAKPVGSTAATAISDKTKRLAKCINTHFSSGHARAIGHILGEALDDPNLKAMTSGGQSREIPGFFVGKEWVKGAAIVPLTCNNGHCYDIGKVCIMGGYENRGYRLRGSLFDLGDHMDTSEGAWRPATKEEIAAAMAEMRPNLKAEAEIPL